MGGNRRQAAIACNQSLYLGHSCQVLLWRPATELQAPAWVLEMGTTPGGVVAENIYKERCPSAGMAPRCQGTLEGCAVIGLTENVETTARMQVIGTAHM